MPPHLHPRSRFTSSLFATTLFASFFVVALPHVLPCPAPRLTYADDGTPQRGRRKQRRKCVDVEGEGEGTGQLKDSAVMEESGDDSETLDSRETRRSKRECPVPKPGGLVGEILGFKGSSSDGKGSRPP